MDQLALSFGILQAIAALAVTVLAPIVTRKIQKRETREAIANVADAALVLAIMAAKSKTFTDLGELIREVVANIMRDPAAPRQLREDSNLAMKAAAAAISRAGLAAVQTVHANADGTITPLTKTSG